MRAILLLIGVLGAVWVRAQAAPADTLYVGGDILTMAGDVPTYVEALAVRDGRIAFAGARAEAQALVGADTTTLDLGGRALLPGFIDAHGHLWQTGFQASLATLLPPPDGDGRDIASLVRLVRGWRETHADMVGRMGWIVATGYDDAQLAERRHPLANELDGIATDVPALLVHQSGHLAALNHAGLVALGYGAGTEDPAGGVIRREADGVTPNGVIEEAALAPAYAIMARLDAATSADVARAAVATYARNGFTTAQEGRASPSVAEGWRQLGEAGAVDIDVAVYPDVQQGAEYVTAHGVTREYRGHVRIAGVKLSLDGSPQGKTAWLTTPYVVPPHGQSADYRGYPAIADDGEVARLVDLAYANAWQLLVHCNGDAAADQLIAAVRAVSARRGLADRRTVMIHAQTVREDQLDAMQSLGILPSFFGLHTFYWGDWHRDETLGRERAYRISPAQSALRRGMIFTEHHDAPVVPPNALRVVWAAANRTSRSGDVIGAEQRIGAYDALRSVTVWAAYQLFEDDRKGTLEPGKFADFVILDRNPLRVPVAEIAELRVLETVKEGRSIYAAR